MKSFSILIFALASTLLLAVHSLPICIVLDPAIVDSGNPDLPANEPLNLVAGAELFNHTIINITDVSSLAGWTAALDQCGVLIIPEVENVAGTPLLADTVADRDAIIALIQTWTSNGGLVISGGGFDNIDFLDEAFDLPYGAGDDLYDDELLNRTAAGATTRPFSGAPATLTVNDATMTLTDAPTEQCMYNVGDTCAIAYTRYGASNATAGPAEGGAILYMGWDWYGAAPNGPEGGDSWVPLLFRQVVDGDCDGNGVIDSLEPDCNANGVADVCEIQADPSLDCDGNQVLDSCQIAADITLDCDVNGVLDTCDLAQGAVDCDENGVLDRCQPQPVQCVGDGSDGTSVGDGGDGTEPTSESESSYGYTDYDGQTSTDGATADGATTDGDGDGDGSRSSAARLRSGFFL